MGGTKFRCCVPSCDSHYPNECGIHFFKLPLETARREKWMNIFNQLPNIRITPTSRICQLHFTDKHFTNTKKHNLSKFAYPDRINRECSEESSRVTVVKAPTELVLPSTEECAPVFLSLPSTSSMRPSTPERNFSNVVYHTPKQSSKTRKSILRKIGEKRSNILSPRTKVLYKEYTVQKGRICKLKSQLQKSRNTLKMLSRASNTDVFRKLEQNFNNVTANLIRSQFRNFKKNNPSWDRDDKIFALAVYKRGPKCYRFLRNFLNLPSRSTLQRLVQDIPLTVGINMHVIISLEKRLARCSEELKQCVLLFDEMALKQTLTYDKAHDKIVGYVDLGHLGRSNQEANHALVFMLSSLSGKWKQPIAFYFTKDQIKTVSLKKLLIDILSCLIERNIHVVGCVCDQGTTNVAAVSQLVNSTNEGGHHIVINGRRIFMFYDTPHIIKNIRNTLLQYDIHFDINKVAKWAHIEEAYKIDLTRRFQAMRKIKPLHFKLNLSFVKMKVSFAAQIFSSTVAASIESMVASANLPAEAIYTAEFAHLTDSIFDSLNSRNIGDFPGKPLKRAISRSSGHIKFWNTIIPKLENWKFFKNGVQCKAPRCIKGLIFTMNSMKEFYAHYFQSEQGTLKTRCVQQDPLENFFSTVCQYGAANINPTPHQFLSYMKTAIVNNLSSCKTLPKNCEDDECQMLINLKDFLGAASNIHTPPVVTSELLNMVNISIDRN